MTKKFYLVFLTLIIVILLAASLLFVYFRDTFYSTNYEVSTMSYSTKYYELSPNGESSTKYWRQGMVTGNGMQGLVTASAPYSDTLTYQNIHFVMPNKNPRVSPDTSAELETVRQAIINKESYSDDQPYLDSFIFHPGAQVRLSQPRQILKDYLRYTNYETAEVGVKYLDKNGDWLRTSFTSQVDGVTITKFTNLTNDNSVTTSISIDDVSKLPNFGDGGEVDMLYKKIVDSEGSYIAQVAHYPDYETSDIREAGYATVTYVIVEGGSIDVDLGRKSNEKQNVGNNPSLNISKANNVYLLTISDRDLEMGAYSDFAKAESYDIVDELLGKIKIVAEKYTEDGVFNYDSALKAHTDVFTPLYDSVKFTLGEENDPNKSLSNEKLIEKQKHSKTILNALAERAYYSGRYAMLCCSGYTTSRLHGAWTGEWNGGWGSKYTMDANVNLQTSSLNSSNISTAPIGYANFILRQVDDWEDNAKTTHNMTNAIQAPVNCDGDRALMVESCYGYPFRYWNAGASWLLEPLYETWQTYGNIQIPISDEFNLYDIASVLSLTDTPLTNEEIQALIDRGYLNIEEDVLLPLLLKSANYWEQLCTPEYYTSNDGTIHYEAGKTALNENERFCIIPSYSPENWPGNYDSPSAANSAIDIGACNSNIEMLCAIMNDLGMTADTQHWLEFQKKIPSYVYDETGALKEWATTSFTENNTHRHLSHLYCAWPLDETQDNEELTKAAKQAVLNRASENEASHALVHRSLICARLKDNEGLEDALYDLMSSKIYYTSLMTNHHTNARSAYCTDYTIGYTGILNESLMYSNSSVLEVLPSKISYWDKGSIKGLMARCKTEVEIRWDNKSVVVIVKATDDTSFTVKNNNKYSVVKQDGAEIMSNEISLTLEKGQVVQLEYIL